jgi:hypothetical protein
MLSLDVSNDNGSIFTNRTGTNRTGTNRTGGMMEQDDDEKKHDEKKHDEKKDGEELISDLSDDDESEDDVNRPPLGNQGGPVEPGASLSGITAQTPNAASSFCLDPENEEDLSTVLSALDDNVINRYDMDENEVEDFYRENDLDSNLSQRFDYLNLSKMIAKYISNPIRIYNNGRADLDPSIIFDYIIAERTKRGKDIDFLLKNRETALSLIENVILKKLIDIDNVVKYIDNEINRINFGKVLQNINEKEPINTGGNRKNLGVSGKKKKTRKFKKKKRNTIRNK